MKSSIGVAVIGTGYWGKNHVRVYKSLENSGTIRFKKICDANPIARKKIAQQYHLESTGNYKEILNDPEIDAVSICTPNDTHYKLGMEFLKAGKNLLIEKPLALTFEEAEQLTEFAEKEKLILMVGHVFRFNPLVRKLKEELKKGTLGNIYLLAANRTCLFAPKRECGVIIDLAIHDVDITLYLLDEKLPRKIHATGSSFLSKKFEETAFIALDFGDTTSYIFSSWLFPNKVRETWTIGSKAGLHLDYVSEKMRMFKDIIIPNAHSGFEVQTGPCKEFSVEKQEPLKLELTRFVENVKRDQQPEVDGHIASRVIKVCQIAAKSLVKQRPLVVR